MVTAGRTTAFTLVGQAGNATNGRSYTTSPITATLTPNFNGTGRTLLAWVIPAGTILQAGQYGINQQTALTVGAGRRLRRHLRQ
jgi:hypothetical protein